MQISPLYKHLVQKPSCCGAACLQMILFRKGHWVEQEDLAYQLGTKIKVNRVKFFNENFVADDQDAGIPLEKFSEIKDLLSKYRLKSKVIKVNEIKNFKELIEDNLKQDNDIIVNFSRLAYYPDRDWGHYALIRKINGEEMEICDPSYHDKACWKTTVSKLLESMTNKFDGKERGIVIVSKVDNLTELDLKEH